MIPQFPKFKRLELADKKDLEKITLQYPPYSDFNFISLYSYDTHNLCQIAILNDNLVIKFTDYITSKPFLTFIGHRLIPQSIETIINFAIKQKIKPELKLVPEVVINNIEPALLGHFDIQEDPDNHDYILDINQVINLPGNKFRSKRRQVKKFMTAYPKHTINILDPNATSTLSHIEKLFAIWTRKQNKNDEDTFTEFTAIQRFIRAGKHYPLTVLGIFNDKNELIAFSGSELAHDKHYMAQFGKADYTYEGSFAYLKYSTAKHMKKHGSEYINFEQDLGIESMRLSKQMWHPHHYLKKYIIKSK